MRLRGPLSRGSQHKDASAGLGATFPHRPADREHADSNRVLKNEATVIIYSNNK